MPTFTITIGGVERTLTEIHKGSGISLSHISQIFSGKKEPSMPSARKIATVFGVTLDRLEEILKETANANRARGGAVASWREEDQRPEPSTPPAA